MCRPCGPTAPAQRLLAPPKARLGVGAEHADAVDPAAEVGRDADVGRGGHHPLADALDSRASSTSTRPNASCVESAARGACRRAGGQRRPASGRTPAAVAQPFAGGGAQPSASGEPGSKPPTRRSASGRSARRSSSICSPVRSAEWLSGWPAIGSPTALDRVGEDHGRPVGALAGGREGVEQVARGRGRRGRGRSDPIRPRSGSSSAPQARAARRGAAARSQRAR